MKIIFDDEEEKKEFIDSICPSNIGRSEFCRGDGCEKCWQQAGVEIKVGEWIPCSERLPEKEYDTVLVVTDDEYYYVAVYTKEFGFRSMDIGVSGKNVAWQLLPEPYKEE